MHKITRDQFFDFIKTKDNKAEEFTALSDTEHYLEYFDRFKKTGKKGNWNWALIFGPYYFFYRHMYFYGIMLYILPLMIIQLIKFCIGFFPNMVWQAISDEIVTAMVLTYVIITIVLIRYGDYIYLNHVSNKIHKGSKISGVNNWVLTLVLFNAVCRFMKEDNKSLKND